MSELFKKNLERKLQRKKIEEAENSEFQQYRHLVMDLCPPEFEVKVHRDKDCTFLIKESFNYANSQSYGFIMDRDVANNVTSKKELVTTIAMLCENCLKEWREKEILE